MADYKPTEMMTVAAARALKNDDVCFVGIGPPSAACNLARLTHAPDITLIYESGTHRHQADRAAAVDRRRRTVRDRADHRVGAGDVPLLAAGRPHHGRLPRRRADRQIRQSQHHGGRRLTTSRRCGCPAAAARRRSRRRAARSSSSWRRASAASSRSSISSPRSATATGGDIAQRARRQDQGPDQADHRSWRVRARSRDEGDDRRRRSIPASPASRSRRTPAGRCASPPRSTKRRRRRRKNSRCCANCTRAPTAPMRRRDRAMKSGGVKDEARMRDVFLCDAVRTPIGRYGGALAKVRTDDLAAVPIKALMARNPKVDWEKLDEVYLRLRQPGRRGQPQRRAHGAAAGRACRRACRASPSTGCAPRASKRSAPPRAPSAPARWNSPSPAASNR